ADDGNDRLTVELCVVKSVQEMDGAGAGGGETDAGLTGEFRVRAGHERGHFFVADLDEIDRVTGAIERADDAVDAVAGVAVDAAHAPLAEAGDEEVGGGLRRHQRRMSFEKRLLRLSW